MKRVVLVSNGHGENAIAARIARETLAASAARGVAVAIESFPLVGDGQPDPAYTITGPRAPMPSGGLVAMGNVAAFGADLKAGFAQLFARQIAFVRTQLHDADLVVAVGDAYALMVALQSRRPAFFVGTAKSVLVAPYGPFERTVLARAQRIFVRDPATAARLQEQGVAAEAPGNVIVDLAFEAREPAERIGFDEGAIVVGLFPGSRTQAYTDAVRLSAVARELALRDPRYTGLLSVAPGLDPTTVMRLLAEDGWAVARGTSPRIFSASSQGARLHAWSGPLGAVLEAASLIVGQAGTANEMAAAVGLPVVALEGRSGGREDWYRMRQRKLLGEALALVSPDPRRAAASIEAIVCDPVRLLSMRVAGPQRMGPPGGARAIGDAIAGALAA